LKVDVWKEKITLYKDMVSAVEGIAPVSASWAKKHVLGMSDEEIRLDIQQQRIERAVAKELTDTPTIIVRTGIFDTVDKLYGNLSGSTQASSATPPESPMGGGMETPPPPAEAPPPAEGGSEVTPESVKKDNLKILVEHASMISDEDFIDLSKARNSLGQIQDELDKLLDD
jgi:hypothetical protein